MAEQKLVCLYPNSGAFGFGKEVVTHSVGWVGSDDPTIRPIARALTVLVPPPVEPTLAALCERAWREQLPGPLWILPKAHWAYELDFGSAAWMPQLLQSIEIDADLLSSRHDGTAIELTLDESLAAVTLIEGLLTNLLGSDFQLCFPGRDLVCTVHHHKQLWWTSTDEQLIDHLRRMPAFTASSGTPDEG